MKPGAKAVIIFLFVAAVVGLFAKFGVLNKLAPKGKQYDMSLTSETKQNIASGKEPIVVCVVTWGGYAGGQYFNGGFKADTNSRYYRDYGILVEFKVMDDFDASRKAWIADKCNLLWVTADAYPTETGGMAQYSPKLIFQADWSRGGDAIVVKRGINSVSDLRGKKIAVAQATPSNTFLLKMLQANDMNYDSVQIVYVPSAIDAGTAFRARKVDAAVVWSPDDMACVDAIAGSKVLTSTREATNIIADGFYVKDAYLQSHKRELTGLVEGWLKGAAEVNNSEEAKDKAADILSHNLAETTKQQALQSINNTRLTNFGDNLNFFGLNPNYHGVKGEDLYSQMAMMYTHVGIIQGAVPDWRLVIDTSIIQMISLEGQPGQEAEGTMKFEQPTQVQYTAPALTVKRLTVTFPTGSAVLDDNAKNLIEIGFVDEAKQFGNLRIRIEGNTDSVGDYNSNIKLSQARAAAVKHFLVETYGFDANRFMVIGNGPSKPVADNSSPEGRAKNRRTEFQLLK